MQLENTQLNYHQAINMLKYAEILYSETQIQNKIITLAHEIQQDLDKEQQIPIFLPVMNGGMFFAVDLLKHLTGPFMLDYIHASRYGNEHFGSSHITWFRQPNIENIRGKTVYIIDDILDEGYTLIEIKRFLLNAGAKDCKIIVLIDKDINKIKPITANYVGFNAPNKFLFGYGLDLDNLYRQLTNIYIYTNES